MSFPQDGIYTVTHIDANPSSGIALLTLQDGEGDRLVPADAGPLFRALRDAGVQRLPITIEAWFTDFGTLASFTLVEEA